MNSERFRVRGYDVFLVQGWGKWTEGCSTELKYVTCDVTSSLCLIPLFPVRTPSLPHDCASQPIFLAVTLQPSPFPNPFSSSWYLLPLHLSSLSPKPALSALYFSRSVMAVRLPGVSVCCLSSTARLNVREDGGSLLLYLLRHTVPSPWKSDVFRLDYAFLLLHKGGKIKTSHKIIGKRIKKT